MTATCPSCQRQLVSRALWLTYGGSRRDALKRTHAPFAGGDKCMWCQHFERRLSLAQDPDLAYTGGWVRRGLVMVPTGPRPVDVPESVSRQNTRADGGRIEAAPVGASTPDRSLTASPSLRHNERTADGIVA